MSEESFPLSVIIVSYNTRVMTLDCLATLYRELDGLPAEVWVVDNASTDGSAEAIRDVYPGVKLIENRHNAGFAAANNQAMREAAGEYLLLLNSDAFPRSGAISALIRYLEEHPGVGLVGPRLLNADGSLQRSCWRFPTPGRSWLDALWISGLWADHPKVGDYRRWPHDRERGVDFVIGACMLVRRGAYERVGGFDERFFMYAEETDWQRRMTDAGWRVAFTPAAEVVHLGGASGVEERPRVRQNFFDSQDHYYRKHHGALGLLIKRLGVAFGNAVRVPLWGLIFLVVPGRRALARAKMKLCGWLVLRELNPCRRLPAVSTGGLNE